MAASTSEEDWNSNCDTVKRAHNGYPEDWYVRIIASGLLKRTANKFGNSGEISIVAIVVNESSQ